ncbi:MaoC/PaaZ C-terminal domain-containing protein [Thermodesulfobacteriota bacterium]
MDKLYFEDYILGEKKRTPGRTITESDLVMWSAFTGDWHPLHTDKSYAANSPFGERIAHGMLVLAVGSALIFRFGQYEILPKSFIAFYGMETVRFMNPVKIGDTLSLEWEVTELIEKDEKRGIFTSRNVIQNQDGEDCCVYIQKILCGRKPKGK